MGLIPGSRRPLGGGHGGPLQYSCLENPTDRGARWVMVHGTAKSLARLERVSTHQLLLPTAPPERSARCVVSSAVQAGDVRTPSRDWWDGGRRSDVKLLLVCSPGQGTAWGGSHPQGLQSEMLGGIQSQQQGLRISAPHPPRASILWAFFF